MNDMDEKKKISSFLRRIWLIAATALQEWFFNEIQGMEDFSSPPGNRRGKDLSSPDHSQRKRPSGTSEGDPSELMSLFSAEEILPEEAFLPGFQSETSLESQTEKTAAESYGPPSDGSSEGSGSSGKEQNPVSYLHSSTGKFSEQRSEPAENGTEHDRDGETLLPGSFPETDHAVSSERSVAIRTMTVPDVHESRQLDDVLPQSPITLPEDFPLTVTTISNPEMFLDESGRNTGTVSYVSRSGRVEDPVLSVPDSSITTTDTTMDIIEKGFLSFPVSTTTDQFLFPVSGSWERGNVKRSDPIQEDFVSSAFFTDGKSGSGDLDPEEKNAVLSADENQKEEFSVTDINMQEGFSISAYGNGYDPGEMDDVLPETAMGSLDPEKLSLYEQALRYLNGEVRSAEGKNLSGFQYPAKNTFSDAEDESSAVNVFDSAGNIPEIFSVPEMDDSVIRQLSAHIRTGGLITGNFSSVSVPGPMFSEKNSGYSAGELLSERMKESIKVLNKINVCCENLKQIVNEGMNI